jgi:hypothetical protein
MIPPSKIVLTRSGSLTALLTEFVALGGELEHPVGHGDGTPVLDRFVDQPNRHQPAMEPPFRVADTVADTSCFQRVF